VQTPTGRTVVNPLLAALRSAERRCAALLGEFGMTPSARSKVRVDQVSPEDAIAAKYFGPQS
jgi:phage terminase small subunit